MESAVNVLLQLLENGLFRRAEDAWKAAHLTQYLLTLEDAAFEHSLALNKILCLIGRECIWEFRFVE